MKRDEFLKILSEFRENALLIGSAVNLCFGDNYSRVECQFGFFKQKDGKWVVYQNSVRSSDVEWRIFFSDEESAIDFVVSLQMCGTVCFEEDYTIYEYKCKYFILDENNSYIPRVGLAWTMDKEHPELTGNKKRIRIPRDYKKRFREKHTKVKKK